MSKQKKTIKTKIINDSIHGPIKISSLARSIIDTEWFQRLRHISQLGLCSLVFPSASHSRFAHSLGTYHTTDLYLQSLIKNSDKKHLNKCISEIPELKSQKRKGLTKHVCELIKIAGLCHDLGHSFFSHVFDDMIIKSDAKEAKHEYRSQIIFEKIITENKIPITKYEIKFIQDLINPRKECVGFVYQIISNCIDTDKRDYIPRDIHAIGQNFGFNPKLLYDYAKVIDNTICFLSQFAYEIQSLFNARYKLHKQIYCHPKILSLEFMVRDLIELIDKDNKIRDSIFNLDSFVKMTDDRLWTMFADIKESENKEAYNLYQNIMTRKLYKFAGKTSHVITLGEHIKTCMTLNLEEISKGYLTKNDYVVHSNIIGYISGSDKKNPLDSIYIYSRKEPNLKFKLNINEVDGFSGGVFQEHNVHYFCKNPEKFECMKKLISSKVNI